MNKYTPFQTELMKPIFDGEGEDVYMKACDLLPENPVVVEIGSAKGWSAVLMGLRVQKKKGIYFSLDNFSQAYIYGDPLPIAVQFANNIKKAGVSDTVMQMYANSQTCDWPKRFAPDLVFIDGEHSYEGCVRDCQNWFPRIEKGKLVMFHDYEFPEVKKAVTEQTKIGWTKIAENYKIIIFQKD